MFELSSCLIIKVSTRVCGLHAQWADAFICLAQTVDANELRERFGHDIVRFCYVVHKETDVGHFARAQTWVLEQDDGIVPVERERNDEERQAEGEALRGRCLAG